MKFQNSSIHGFKVMLCIKKRDFVAKIIKWLLILSAYYCPSLCVYKLHLATLGMDYLSIAIILLCG